MEVGSLTHSHSQPEEMEKTPPGTPKKGGKLLAVRVQMLDDTVTIFQVQAKALGRVLFDQVCNQLNLLEADYFGLEYQEAGGTKYWLDLEKPVCRQIGLSLVDILVRFCVKFYTPDPSQLEEEFTRYLFCLQIKRDLSQGLLQCNSNTAALMASYIVQAECGDYVVEDYPDHRYLSSFKFVPNQDQELERRIMENHKKHAGQSPAEADLNLLETARRCELYGIKMHPAKDHEGCPLNLAVAHMGIVVFQNFSKINTFSWAKIRKISFKRKKFLVKLHPEGYGYYKDTVEFFFEGRNECKNFWKKCVENHGFFRCTMVKKVPRQKTRVLSRGSSFRYSGRTQKQIVDFVRENYVKRQTFQRSQSFRHSSSAHSSVANVGTSISAHPLLPLGDNAVVGTPASLSCGSMTLTSSPVHTADIHAGESPSPPLTTSISPGTSVTSSPQHVYPQGSPYRRTGRRPTKVKHPPLRSHHAISPLVPTDAAPAADNRSASRSNGSVLDVGNSTTSRNACLRSPDELIDFNDVYSNCYTSLRSLRNELENEMIFEKGAKTDIFDLADDFSKGTADRADKLSTMKGKSVLPPNEDYWNRRTWHRSASCRDLCRENEDGRGESEGETELSFGTRSRDRSRRKCYSAATSKNPSMERAGERVNEMRIYSNSYPGTTSNLRGVEMGGEEEERATKTPEAKYDSQEDMGLSHDDVSHDSYELLGRELESGSRRREGTMGDSERARSCSWSSERGAGMTGFFPTESGSGSGSEVAREERSWSSEREKRPKHKSESDFRSLGNAQGESYREEWKRGERREEFPERYRGYGFGKRSWGQVLEETHEGWARKDELESGFVLAKGSFTDKERRRKDFDGETQAWDRGWEAVERQRCRGHGKSAEELVDFCAESTEPYWKVSAWGEDRRLLDKRREKKDREDVFHEGLKEREEQERERERERWQLNHRRSGEERESRMREESSRKMTRKPGSCGDSDEIQFEKFDRVVSNQFGRYSEFLTRENIGFPEENVVLENYEKLCRMNRAGKELKSSLTGRSGLQESMVEGSKKYFGDSMESEEWKRVATELSGPMASVRSGTRTGKALVERTKSDPYDSKAHKKNVLMHQKSIDLTAQQSEETASDHENERGFKKTSRSEHDIPYILRKRHCMNGTAKNADFSFAKAGPKVGSLSKSASRVTDAGIQAKGTVPEEKSKSDAMATTCQQKASSAKLAEAQKAGVQIINLDTANGKVVVDLDLKRVAKGSRSPSTAKRPFPDDKATGPKVERSRKEAKRAERSSAVLRVKKDAEDVEKSGTASEEAGCAGLREKEEPIYAEVCRESGEAKEETSAVPPQPPKRSSSVPQREVAEERRAGERGKGGWEEGKGRGEGGAMHRRREESLTLFARTRLGVSEGSAFAAVPEGGAGSPACQRRTKSLDAPYVSVHSLPPADAFSSKDDTVEGWEGDVVSSAVTRLMGLRKGGKPEGKKGGEEEKGEGEADSEVSGNAETEADSVFAEDLGMESKGFKKALLSQSKVEMSLGEEKVLDGVRGKRLLSKIESVDLIDSEGDPDSSRMTEPPRIPSDRLVNLPESIRFPSVRQISGQTSEESADGWEQKEVKVKRRTGRRSVGREEQEEALGESVVWDSKDEEPPDDEVWDDKSGSGRRREGAPANGGLASEYSKRGSCGQSIDDDNLSTPMKESSPEHWVSVDDLPEALEREEKLLRQQERVLREKILNEKLKRELNLDSIDLEESTRRSRYEEETASLKQNFKGHSLDSYELIEKKSRGRAGRNNCSSLDEELLGERAMDHFRCKVVKDVAEMDVFGDNDEELEEFFVVLEENVGTEGGSLVWGNVDSSRRTPSNDESLISVPEEFKDVKEEGEESGKRAERTVAEAGPAGRVEIRLSGEEPGRSLEKFISGREEPSVPEILAGAETWVEERSLRFAEGAGAEEFGRGGVTEDVGRLSPFDGSRRGSEENRKSSFSEDAGRLSPYDVQSRRGSEEHRKSSTSEDAGRLSPLTDSRRGSEEPGRLSTSEDSRKCSASESFSVSEETRRRLSSTEETRRKRASLTKQCSVGADSLSDEVVSGIRECSSSFEHDERDVFETEPATPRLDEAEADCFVAKKVKERDVEEPMNQENAATEDVRECMNAMYLAPPSSERELSRETEDSLDYAEGDFRDIRDTVKEKEMSEEPDADKSSGRGLGSDQSRPSLREKSESSENGEFRYIDEKSGGTPEMIVGKSREAVAMSIVVVNEGLSVLEKLKEGREEGGMVREAFSKAGGRGGDLSKASPKPKLKPKPSTSKALEYGEGAAGKREWRGLGKRSLDSSQESDLDRLSDISLVSHVRNEIARRNLSEAGRYLRSEEVGEGVSLGGDSGSGKTSSEDDGLPGHLKTSSEERERTDPSSADELVVADKGKGRERKTEGRGCLRSEGGREKREVGLGVGKGKRSPDWEKRDSGEDGSSSSSAPPCPKRELSSTWKPFLLESSGSSSLEEGWLPPDENAHLADEEETSSTSNNQQDDSCHDEVDYPTGIGYPVLGVSAAEMMVGGYGGVYALSRTLSRISERSASEQERSDLEDDITKPSSRSTSVEEESILSSDRQPSLSSDPPSPRESASAIPDLPVDRPAPKYAPVAEDRPTIFEPFGDVVPPPVTEEDWPSPPSSSSVIDTPVVSHIETFYMEIHPEEACKVTVAGSRDEGESSSDENQTLHEESEFLVLSSDNVSGSTTTTTTTTTTQDGTVVIPVRPRGGKRSSPTEDGSVASTSDRPGIARELTEGDQSRQDPLKPKASSRTKPPKLQSPTAKNFGFFETPVSKVRSPTSQIKFFDADRDRGTSAFSHIRSPTPLSETAAPKSSGIFFDSSSHQNFTKVEASEERRTSRSPVKSKTTHRLTCTPYYSNVADSAEQSYFGHYDTGSLERTRIRSSRKSTSYYFVSRPAPNEGYAPQIPEPNTIPRASRKTKTRHRVAMDLIVRDGRILAPPKTKTTVLENSDEDRASPNNA